MVVKNVFDKGPESWCSYDYHASVVTGRGRVFVLANWEREGGLNGAPYISCEETYWTPDLPEKPLSILPFMHYRSWIGEDPIDLRDLEVSVYLRGDGLKLNGGECYFWVVGPATRWHLNSRPIDISMGEWASDLTTLRLANDEASWHMSWSSRPGNPTSLDECLANCNSYGFSFVGFSAAVQGKLSMGAFEIR